MEYFLMIAMISLFCLGLRAITDDGMIGAPIRTFFLKVAPYWGKPIVLCTTCMSSFWGTVIFWGHALPVDSLSLSLISTWVGVSISSSFVNSVLWEYYQSITTCKK